MFVLNIGQVASVSFGKFNCTEHEKPVSLDQGFGLLQIWTVSQSVIFYTAYP